MNTLTGLPLLPELLWGRVAPLFVPVWGEGGGPSHHHAARPAVGGTPPSHPQTSVPPSCTWRASQTPFRGTQELREGGCVRGGAQQALQKGPSAGHGTTSLLCPCRLGRVHQAAGGPQAGGTLKAAKACTRLPQTCLGPAVPRGTSSPARVPAGLGPGLGADLLRPFPLPRLTLGSRALPPALCSWRPVRASCSVYLHSQKTKSHRSDSLTLPRRL